MLNDFTTFLKRIFSRTARPEVMMPAPVQACKQGYTVAECEYWCYATPVYLQADARAVHLQSVIDQPLLFDALRNNLFSEIEAVLKDYDLSLQWQPNKTIFIKSNLQFCADDVSPQTHLGQNIMPVLRKQSPALQAAFAAIQMLLHHHAHDMSLEVNAFWFWGVAQSNLLKNNQ